MHDQVTMEQSTTTSEQSPITPPITDSLGPDFYTIIFFIMVLCVVIIALIVGIVLLYSSNAKKAKALSKVRRARVIRGIRMSAIGKCIEDDYIMECLIALWYNICNSMVISP